jgi:predicted RNA-binding Zn-ribbon protein involved in translation (DUF1610 family)
MISVIFLEPEEHAVCNKELELDEKTKGYYCANCDSIVLEPCLKCSLLEFIGYQCKNPGRISNG